MKNKNCLLFCLMLLGLGPLLLNGCSPVSPQVTYYSLLDSSQTLPAAKTQGHLALLIGPVTLPDALKTSQIATGGAGGQYQLSDHHRWASEVDRDFARALGEQLATRLGTEQIALYPLDQYLEPTQQVVADILTMEGALGEEARLTVRWSVLDPKSKKSRLTRRSSFSEQPVDATYGAWVNAQRRNISRLSEAIAVEIRSMP